MALLSMLGRIRGSRGHRTFRPTGRVCNRLSKVSDFISSSRTWDVVAVEEHFVPEDVAIILAIPLSHRVSCDKLMWHYDNKGRFSTKSAYQLARQLVHESPSSSSSAGNVPFWKHVWFAGVSSKVKVHMWQVCSAILPTVSVLRKKMVFLENGCFLCNAKNESIEHVSRDCCFTRDLIKMFPKLRGALRSVVQPMSMMEWLSGCLEFLSKDEFSL